MTLSEVQQAAAVRTPSRLRWCVGKIVYARGASRPLHFMELKKFIIDDATDYSHLFYLRGLRTRNSNQETLDEELKRWMEGTAVKQMAEVLHHVVCQLPNKEIKLVEYFPGVGLAFEYLKLLLKMDLESGLAGGKHIALFEGRGPSNLQNQFMVLQQDGDYAVQYADESKVPLESPDASTVGLFNYNQTVRYGHAPTVDVAGFLENWKGPAVITMRVTKGPEKETHTNVMGRAIQLPSLREAVARCQESGLHWYYRFNEGFDAGFFLPDVKGSTGLFIAYTAGHPSPLKGFDAI